ncbi:MAG: VPLPA-CTERM sorting domain-containing protein [Pseudomonadota bacterium]
MKAFTKIAGALLLALSPMGASAATFSNLTAVYDDSLKLFEFRGTVETTTLSQFDEIEFLIDIPFNFGTGAPSTNLIGATLPISSIGGDFDINPRNSGFSITNFFGSPAGTPFDFLFFVSTPNGSNRFTEARTQIILADNSGVRIIVDRTRDPFAVTLGVTSIPLPAGGWLLLSGLGGLALLRRRTIVSNF